MDTFIAEEDLDTDFVHPAQVASEWGRQQSHSLPHSKTRVEGRARSSGLGETMDANIPEGSSMRSQLGSAVRPPASQGSIHDGGVVVSPVTPGEESVPRVFAPSVASFPDVGTNVVTSLAPVAGPPSAAVSVSVAVPSRPFDTEEDLNCPSSLSRESGGGNGSCTPSCAGRAAATASAPASPSPVPVAGWHPPTPTWQRAPVPADTPVFGVESGGATLPGVAAGTAAFTVRSVRDRPASHSRVPIPASREAPRIVGQSRSFHRQPAANDGASSVSSQSPSIAHPKGGATGGSVRVGNDAPNVGFGTSRSVWLPSCDSSVAIEGDEYDGSPDGRSESRDVSLSSVHPRARGNGNNGDVFHQRSFATEEEENDATGEALDGDPAVIGTASVEPLVQSGLVGSVCLEWAERRQRALAALSLHDASMAAVGGSPLPIGAADSAPRRWRFDESAEVRAACVAVPDGTTARVGNASQGRGKPILSFNANQRGICDTVHGVDALNGDAPCDADCFASGEEADQEENGGVALCVSSSNGLEVSASPANHTNATGNLVFSDNGGSAAMTLVPLTAPFTNSKPSTPTAAATVIPLSWAALPPTRQLAHTSRSNSPVALDCGYPATATTAAPASTVVVEAAGNGSSVFGANTDDAARLMRLVASRSQHRSTVVSPSPPPVWTKPFGGEGTARGSEDGLQTFASASFAPFAQEGGATASSESPQPTAASPRSDSSGSGQGSRKRGRNDGPESTGSSVVAGVARPPRDAAAVIFGQTTLRPAAHSALLAMRRAVASRGAVSASPSVVVPAGETRVEASSGAVEQQQHFQQQQQQRSVQRPLRHTPTPADPSPLAASASPLPFPRAPGAVAVALRAATGTPFSRSRRRPPPAEAPSAAGSTHASNARPPLKSATPTTAAAAVAQTPTVRVLLGSALATGSALRGVAEAANLSAATAAVAMDAPRALPQGHDNSEAATDAAAETARGVVAALRGSAPKRGAFLALCVRTDRARTGYLPRGAVLDALWRAAASAAPMPLSSFGVGSDASIVQAWVTVSDELALVDTWRHGPMVRYSDVIAALGI